jgi:hypothetical protein
MGTPNGKGQYVDIRSASEMSVPGIQASMENALQSAAQSAAENLFGSGTFGNIMNDTVTRVATIQSTYHGTYDTADAATGDRNIDSKRSKGQKVKFCHHTSATGTMFGKIWVKTVTVKTEARKGSPKGAIDIVTSFVFYPSWWLTKIGLGHGMEANLSNSTDGWKFNFSPVRAVSDNSLIFEFCESGNLEAVQRLITRGDASVRDTNSKGWNPLHVRHPLWFFHQLHQYHVFPKV